jgi:glycosyltransferase involved in cell wall biosynthesis
MPPDISVVIPTFRRPQELVDAVHSALAQTGFSIEVLVVDDSPEGSAREVISALRDPRVSYLKRAVPSGGSPALVRNHGWPLTSGRYVHFLDDDDRVAPGAYRALVSALENQPHKGMAFGRIQPICRDPKLQRHEERFFENAAFRARIGQRLGSRYWMLANLLFKNTLLACSAGMLRRSCLEALGGFDPKTGHFEDLDIYIRAIRRFGGVFVDQVVMFYQTGAPSLVHGLPDRQPVIAAYSAIHEKYRAEYGSLEFLSLKVFARTALRLFPGVEAPDSDSASSNGTSRQVAEPNSPPSL